jgi:hypothetical protein
MRGQVQRRRRKILDLQRTGIPTKSAEVLLGRMLTKVDDLIGDRNQFVGEQRVKYPSTDKIINGAIGDASNSRFPDSGTDQSRSDLLTGALVPPVAPHSEARPEGRSAGRVFVR